MPFKALDNRLCFLVNLRDRLCCRACGKAPTSAQGYHRGFEYHHLIPRSQGGSDTLENLLLLCRECHQALHRQSKQPKLEPTPPLEPFLCRHCGEMLNPYTVEMNCGWYRCARCNSQAPLFNHFELSPT